MNLHEFEIKVIDYHISDQEILAMIQECLHQDDLLWAFDILIDQRPHIAKAITQEAQSLANEHG